MNKDQKEQLDRELSLADLGAQVVNNEAYKQAMTARKAQIFEVFCSTSADQSDIRDEAWRTMKNMQSLEKYFENALTTGKLAQATLEQYDK